MLSRRMLLAAFAVMAASRGLPALPTDLVPSADTILQPRGWEDVLAELLRMCRNTFGTTPDPAGPNYAFCELLAHNIWDNLTSFLDIEQQNAISRAAAGDALDKFGAAFGEDRRGEPDAAYRERLLARMWPPEGDR